MEIKVSITSSKAYVGKITGLSAQYGEEVDFLAMKQISRTLKTAYITEAGVYKVTPRETTICSRRIDTGYIRVSVDGTVTEIAKSDGHDYAESLFNGVVPPIAQN